MIQRALFLSISHSPLFARRPPSCFSAKAFIHALARSCAGQRVHFYLIVMSMRCSFGSNFLCCCTAWFRFHFRNQHAVTCRSRVPCCVLPNLLIRYTLSCENLAIITSVGNWPEYRWHDDDNVAHMIRHMVSIMLMMAMAMRIMGMWLQHWWC